MASDAAAVGAMASDAAAVDGWEVNKKKPTQLKNRFY